MALLKLVLLEGQTANSFF